MMGYAQMVQRTTMDGTQMAQRTMMDGAWTVHDDRWMAVQGMTLKYDDGAQWWGMHGWHSAQ